MTLSEVLWAPQAECGWAHSNQEEQESGELWGCHWRGACAVDPGVQQDCWSQGRGSRSAGAHRTGWCEFKDLQAACSPDRRWGSNSTEQSGRLSTVLCMVLLIRTVTASLQLQRGKKIQCRNGGKYMTIRDLKPVRKLISTDAISLCYQIVYCCYLFLKPLIRWERLMVVVG